MQNRGTHISVQPGRAGVANDESNPRVRHCYSATLLLKKVEQNIRKAFGSTFLKGGIKNMSNLWLHLFERWIKKN